VIASSAFREVCLAPCHQFEQMRKQKCGPLFPPEVSPDIQEKGVKAGGDDDERPTFSFIAQKLGRRIDIKAARVVPGQPRSIGKSRGWASRAPPGAPNRNQFERRRGKGSAALRQNRRLFQRKQRRAYVTRLGAGMVGYCVELKPEAQARLRLGGNVRAS